MLQQAEVHRRHAAEDGAAVLLDRLDDRLELEARDEHDRAAVADAGVQHAGQAEDVEQRQHGDADVGLLELEELAGDGAVHVQVQVRELGALGLAGGAGGVEQHRGLVAVGRTMSRVSSAK
jgi:hypothetical protein